MTLYVFNGLNLGISNLYNFVTISSDIRAMFWPSFRIFIANVRRGGFDGKLVILFLSIFVNVSSKFLYFDCLEKWIISNDMFDFYVH